MANVIIQDARVKKMLNEVALRAKNPVNAFRIVSGMMWADVIDHFKAESAPRGHWKDRAKSTKEAYAKKGWAGRKLLQISGRLRNSFVKRASKNSAEVATGVEYASIHNFGGKTGRNYATKIPKRKFMWLSRGVKDRILNYFGRYLIGREI